MLLILAQVAGKIVLASYMPFKEKRYCYDQCKEVSLNDPRFFVPIITSSFGQIMLVIYTSFHSHL